MNRKMRASLAGIIRHINGFVGDPDSADAALAEMAGVLDSDKALLVRLAGDRRRDIALAYFGIDREFINHVLRERENPDSFLAHEAHWKPGTVATDSDCSRSVGLRPNTKLSIELFAPHDVRHTLLGVIETSEIHHILLWFHRGNSRVPYRQPEKRFFLETMPHWQQAIHLKLAYDLRDSALAAAGAVLDQSPFGLYIIGRDDRVLYSNATAAAQCRENAGLSVQNQVLKFADRNARSDYDRMLSAARHGGKDDDPRLYPISIEKTDGNGSYQLGMRRLTLPARRGSLATRNVVAAYVYDTGSRAELNVSALKSLYQLTDAEARVCELLYQSRNLTEAARALGISINTAKTHLHRSFRKVGVQSQAELVRRLNSQLYLA